ncbi:hypothetical protein [Lactiplantibacillus pentosus]|nr:hypothetical protein [Lactiplantibacillus pentosus]MDT6966888.1 hypothetical protein [Lactiplantibacillus pentosus]MDT6999758.1 hypothetical protein [Lactiplantibacillus pentosus]
MNETVKKQKRLQVNVSPELAEQVAKYLPETRVNNTGCLNDLF